MALSIYLFSPTSALAQYTQINGKVTDNLSKDAVKGATVILSSSIHQQSIASSVTDSMGMFHFQDLPIDEYTISLSSIGFNPKKIVISRTNHDFINIVMEKDGQILTGVTIVAQGPAVTQKDDTSQYNANQYKVNPDATTEDLVKKMPGVTIEKSGAITAHGEQVKKITVDGKDFFGDDASAALKNIPANAVDKIQIYDKLSDQAQMTGIDDGNSQKAINIITKAGLKDAQFGRVFAGIGNQQTYSGGGNVSFFDNDRRISLVGNFNNVNLQNFGSQDMLGLTGTKPTNNMGGGNNRGPGGPVENYSIDPSAGINTTNAIGVNYGDKWGANINVTGSYFFNTTHNDNYAYTKTKYFEDSLLNNKEGLTSTNNFNHRINARIEWKLDTSNMLFIIPSINFQANNSNGNTNLQTINNNNDSVLQSNALALKDKDGYNIKNSIMYRHSFQKKNRLFTISLNTNFNKNDGTGTLNGDYRFYDDFGNLLQDSVQKQSANNNTKGYTIGSSATYNEPVGKKGLGQIQIEYNPSVQKNSSNQLSYQNLNGELIKDSLLSNEFENNIIVHNGGVTYRYTPSRDEQLSFNINYQHTSIINKRISPNSISSTQDYNNLIPYAYWRKKISKRSNIRMFLRGSINFPTVNQLQDVAVISNQSNIITGNKDLKQYYTQYMGSRYSFTDTKTNRNVFANIFFQFADDYISNETVIASKDSIIDGGILLKKGSQLTKPKNMNGYQMIRSGLTYSFPFKVIKTTCNINAGVVYTKMPGMVNYISTLTQNYQYNASIGFVSNINQYIDYNISYAANINNAKTTGSITQSNQYINQTIAVAFNILSKSGWFLQNDFTSQIFNGLSGGYDKTFNIWNVAVGKKFFKDQAGEIKIGVYDLLQQNQSVSRNITNTYLEDSRSNVLQQYYMLTFSYNLKNFGAAKKAAATDDFIPKVGYPSSY